MSRRTWSLVSLALLGAALVAAALPGCSKSPTKPVPPQAASCALSTTSLAFGTLSVGQSADLSFTISNTGQGTLSGTVTSPVAAFVVVRGANYSLTRGQSDTATVRFAPTQAGEASCELSTGASCSAVACSGTGSTPVPGCLVSVTHLDFGILDVGDAYEQGFVISNTGEGTLSGTVTSPLAAFSITHGASYSLTHGQGDTVLVRFAPTQGGTFSGTISTGGTCSGVVATGTARTTSADCQVSPTSLDFGQVVYGSYLCKNFRITNTSASAVIHGDLNIVPVSGEASNWTITPQSYSLNPGEHADFNVCFSPHGVASFSMNVVISDRTLFCHSVFCSGEGADAPPQCLLSLATSPALDFGTLAAGQQGWAKGFWIKNTGGGTLTGRVAPPSADFTVTRVGADTALAYALGSNQEAAFTVAFTPQSAGAKSGVLSLGGAGCGTIRLIANAVPDPGANCAVISSLLFPPYPSGADAYVSIAALRSSGLQGQVYLPCSGFTFPSGATLQTYSVAPGYALSWKVHYGGSYSAQDATCLFNADYTGTSGCPPITATVQGMSSATPIEARPELMDFGVVTIGQFADLTLALYNDTASPVSGTLGLDWVAGLPCSEFQVAGSPAFSIPANGSTTVTLRFQPITGGPHDCALVTSLGSQVNTVELHGTALVP